MALISYITKITHISIGPFLWNTGKQCITRSDATGQVHCLLSECYINETKSASMNIFDFFYFLFKSFVKVELNYIFTINLFTIAENCTAK